MRVLIGTGNQTLDGALTEAARAAGHEPDTFSYAEALLEAKQPGVVAILGPLLPTSCPAGLFEIVLRVRLSKGRVIYLPGDRPRADATLLERIACIGAYDFFFDPVEPEKVTYAIDHPADIQAGFDALRKPGEKTVSTARLGAAFSAARQIASQIASEDAAKMSPTERPARPGRKPVPVLDAAGTQATQNRSEPPTPPPPPVPAKSRRPATGAGVLGRDQGEQVLEALSSGEGPAAILLVAMDALDAFASSRGAKAVKQVLADAERALSACVRSGDGIIRWEADAFLVLLPDADEEAAATASDRARRAFSDLGHPVSTGVAGRIPGESPSEWLERARASLADDRSSRQAALCSPGWTAFIGALPGCGTSRVAVTWARERAATGRAVLLVDAHEERAHLGYYLLGRHLDPLSPSDRQRSWLHIRNLADLRQAVFQPEPNLHLLALAFDPDPPGLLRPTRAAPDISLTWTGQGVHAEVVCRPGRSPQDIRKALDAHGDLPLTLIATAPDLGEGDRQVWERELGVSVPASATAHALVSGHAADLVQRLAQTLQVVNIAPGVGIDLGAARPVTGGLTDPRIDWAARYAHTVVVTRDDPLGHEAAARTTGALQSAARKAGRHASVSIQAVGGRGHA